MQLTGSLLVAAVGASEGAACVTQQVLTCINEHAHHWPKCDPSQSKGTPGRGGFEFGYYCTQEWVDALNSMLSSPQVDMCGDSERIAELLGQMARQTGYFSTMFHPRGGAGLIHMRPENWAVNAADMDEVFGNHGFASAAASMGKNFFQSSQYGWLSVAAWYKRTNRQIAGCDKDLFHESYDTHTRCIFGSDTNRSEVKSVAQGCLNAHLTTTTLTTPAPETTQEPTATTTSPSSLSPEQCRTCLTVCSPCQDCTDGPDGTFAFGSCEKCWHCWDWDDDELEDKDKDMDKDCDALHRKHDWNDEEVRCLTNDRQDCRACYGLDSFLI